MTPKAKYPIPILFVTSSKLQVYFAILSLCLIVVYSASVCIYRPYDNLAWRYGRVTAIGEKGAKEAGFQLDDLALEIDGVAPDPLGQVPMYKPFLPQGQQVIYKVQRGEQVLMIPLRMGSYLEEPDYLAGLLIEVFLSLCFWVTGSLLCIFAPADIRARLLGLSWLLAGVAMSTGTVGVESQFWGYGTLMKVCFAALVFVMIAQHLYFPAPSLTSNQRRWIIRFAAAVSLFLIGQAIVDDTLIKPLLNRPTQLSLWIYTCFLVSVVFSIGLLMRNCFLSGDPDVRRQTGIVIYGTILGFSPFFILNLIPALLSLPYPVNTIYTLPFLLFIPLSYAYVIYQKKLLKIDWAINRFLVLFVVILLILLLAVTILGSLALWLNLSPELPILGGLFAIAVVISSASIQKRVQVGIDRALYGVHYNHALVTSSLSSQLARTLEHHALTNLLTKSFPQQTGIRQSALLLLKGGRLESQSDNFSIAVNDQLCMTLLNSSLPIRTQKLWGLVSEATQETWQIFEWGEVFAPIVFENRLHGILILGERVANNLYSDQDLQIIAAVANQAALATDNIHLFEKVRGHARQLVQADEEQRRKISLELHDGVLQNIFFVKKRAKDPEMIEYLNRSIANLRRTIKEQRASTLDQGIALALGDLVEDMRKIITTDGTEIVWHSNVDKTLSIGDELATTMYRITQEAITNAIKHAEADRITVSLEKEEDKLTLRIEDDGKGMTVSDQITDEHFGLVGMQERAATVGARLDIFSIPNDGTMITLGATI